MYDISCDQINEFGQAPRQLFTTPHPTRLLKRKSTIVDSDTLSNYSVKSEGFRGLSMQFVSRIMTLASPPPEIPATETSPVPSACVKFQIPLDDVTTNALSETPIRPPRKLRAGTPISFKHAAHLTSSDSDTEGSPSGKGHGDEYVENSERESEGVYDWRTGCAVSSSGLDFPESNDPFDTAKNVEMVLPSKLQKAHLWNSTETIVGQRGGNLEPSKPERRDVQADVAPRKLESDNKRMAWYSMFRQRLSEPQCLKLHRSPVNACILSEENDAGSVTTYSVDKDGFIKVCVSYICLSLDAVFKCNPVYYYLVH